MTTRQEGDGSRSTLRAGLRKYTRSRLLEAGREVLADKGYLNMTVEDISAAAGTSRATFYLHFSTKHEVVAELFVELRPELIAQYEDLDAVVESGDPARLQAWMLSALRWMEANTPVIHAAEVATLAQEPLRYDKFTHTLADHMVTLSGRWPAARRDELRLRVALLANQFRATRSFLLGHPDDRVDSDLGTIAKVMADIWGPALAPPQED